MTIHGLRASVCFQFLALVLLVLCGCQTTDPGTASARSAPGLAPAPLRVAIAPIKLDTSIGPKRDSETGEPETWYFSATTEKQVKDGLLRALRDMKLSSEVVDLSTTSLTPEQANQIDILVYPTLERAAFDEMGISDNAFLSTSLWLLTWLGAHWVHDYDYTSNVTLSCRVKTPSGDDLTSDALNLKTGPISLTFWDRNEPWSLGFFESIIVPTYWTHDNIQLTSESLTEKALTQVAADLKRYLLDEMVTKAREVEPAYPEILVEEPINGSLAHGSVSLKFEIRSNEQPTTRVTLFVNDQQIGEAFAGGESSGVMRPLASIAEQERSGSEEDFRCTVFVPDVALPVRGKNYIRIRLDQPETPYAITQTLVVQNDESLISG